jgi:hypothetical protein
MRLLVACPKSSNAGPCQLCREKDVRGMCLIFRGFGTVAPEILLKDLSEIEILLSKFEILENRVWWSIGRGAGS